MRERVRAIRPASIRVTLAKARACYPGAPPADKQSAARPPQPRIARRPAAVSEKSATSASGAASASVAAVVFPVATATARTPTPRPHRTSWTESPTITASRPSKAIPVASRARASATAGSR